MGIVLFTDSHNLIYPLTNSEREGFQAKALLLMKRQSSLLWLLLSALMLTSAVFVVTRLRDLPVMPVSFGPDLRVRAVNADKSTGAVSPFQRGDRLAALRGRSIEDVREMRSVLVPLGEELGQQRANGEDAPLPIVRYQIVRPIHRFNLLLQGEPLDPAALPPGVEQGDMLVELDGRPMKPKVGTEGLRSIVSSRPESLLVLERRNAVFTGEIELDIDPWPEELLVVILLALLLSLVLWRFQHQTLSNLTSLATAAQTWMFAWSALVIFEYQWVLADDMLAHISIFAIIFARPLGLFARAASVEEWSPRLLSGLGFGLLGAVIVIAALETGRLPNAQVALQFAAVLGTLFVIYEVVLTGFNEGAGMLLGERSIFLGGITLFVLVACLIAYFVEPVSFIEERWRWFAAIVLGVVWFGDVLLCLRGVPASAFADVSSSRARRARMESLLDEVGQVFGQLRPALALVYNDIVWCLERVDDEDGGEGPYQWEVASRELTDAVTILLQEDARVPLPAGVEEHEHPVAGIARTMGIGLAFELLAPPDGLQVDGTAMVLLGYQQDDSMPVSLDEVAYLQSKMTPAFWTSAIIELLSELLDPEAIARAAEPAEEEEEQDEDDIAAELESANEQLDDARAEVSSLRRERRELAALAEGLRQWYNPAPPIPGEFEQLLEPQLVELLGGVLAGAGPVALIGPSGAGKTFLAGAGHVLEQRAPAPCMVYDAAIFDPEEMLANLLGDPDEPGDCAVLDVCASGSLVIQRAEWLELPDLQAIFDAAVQRNVRLYFCFDVDASRAVDRLSEFFDEASVDALLSRAVEVPALSSRHHLVPALLDFYVNERAWQVGKTISDISPAALKALTGYDWPGNIDELIMVMGRAVERCQGNFIELGDLPLDIRRGTY